MKGAVTCPHVVDSGRLSEAVGWHIHGLHVICQELKRSQVVTDDRGVPSAVSDLVCVVDEVHLRAAACACLGVLLAEAVGDYAGGDGWGLW